MLARPAICWLHVLTFLWNQIIRVQSIHVSGLVIQISLLLMHIFFISDRVAVGRALDLPVYFGDAGSREVGRVRL
jgi:hypothetical protein